MSGFNNKTDQSVEKLAVKRTCKLLQVTWVIEIMFFTTLEQNWKTDL